MPFRMENAAEENQIMIKFTKTVTYVLAAAAVVMLVVVVLQSTSMLASS
jgi:low affinity Fe/Cu permease